MTLQTVMETDVTTSKRTVDDDNDLIPDIDDDCASEIGWISNAENDYDSDGCLDSLEDNDDDNDGSR
jgi:hypothetical protein